MANQNYQQTEMDLRTNLQQDVDCRVASVIDDTYDMLRITTRPPCATATRHTASPPITSPGSAQRSSPFGMT